MAAKEHLKFGNISPSIALKYQIVTDRTALIGVGKINKKVESEMITVSASITAMSSKVQNKKQ
jgi:hypothetical protein